MTIKFTGFWGVFSTDFIPGVNQPQHVANTFSYAIKNRVQRTYPLGQDISGTGALVFEGCALDPNGPLTKSGGFRWLNGKNSNSEKKPKTPWTHWVSRRRQLDGAYVYVPFWILRRGGRIPTATSTSFLQSFIYRISLKFPASVRPHVLHMTRTTRLWQSATGA